MDDKITDIKYKQLDKNSEIRGVTGEMEKLLLGEQGIGLLNDLGLTPGRLQKSLDEQFNKDFEELLEKHKEYIFGESRKRSAVEVAAGSYKYG